MRNNNLQLQNDIGLREGTAYTSLTVLTEASQNCRRMRRESRLQSPACLMYLAWPDGTPVWLSGNALASINVVALSQTRLVLGWVTVCGRVNHFGM